MSNSNPRGKSLRMLFVAALATSALASLAALGGVGFAKGSISASQYQYGKEKVVICHKGKTLKVAKPSLKGHMKHGDTLGPCPSDARKGKQKGKGKDKPAGDSAAEEAKKADAPKKEEAEKSESSKSAPGKSEEKGKSGEAPGKSEGKGKGK